MRYQSVGFKRVIQFVYYPTVLSPPLFKGATTSSLAQK